MAALFFVLFWCFSALSPPCGAIFLCVILSLFLAFFLGVFLCVFFCAFSALCVQRSLRLGALRLLLSGLVMGLGATLVV